MGFNFNGPEAEHGQGAEGWHERTQENIAGQWRTGSFAAGEHARTSNVGALRSDGLGLLEAMAVAAKRSFRK